MLTSIIQPYIFSLGIESKRENITHFNIVYPVLFVQGQEQGQDMSNKMVTHFIRTSITDV